MNNKKSILLLFLVLIIVTGFELSILTKISLWHDEAFSALLTRYSFKEMLYRTGLDVHPPFYYILLKGWTGLLGNSLFSLRLFSVFFGVLAVLSLYFLTKEALGHWIFAFFSSVLMTLNSFFIQFVMEARMFTLGIFLVIISTLFLLKALKSKNWSWWFLYALSAGCGIFTHYYVFLSVLAQAIFLIYWILKESGFNFPNWLRNKNFQFALLSCLLIIVSFFPWLKTFLFQIAQIQQAYWIPPINIGSIPATFFKLITGESIDAFRFWYVLTALMVVIVDAVIYLLKKIETPTKWLFFLLLIVPFLGATFLSLKTSIYLDRYFIFTLPFYIILMAGAILVIKSKWPKNTLIVITILGSLVSFPIHWASLGVEKKPGMAAAAAYLNQQAKPGEKVYAGSSFVYFTFKYYNQTEIHPQLYQPYVLPHFSGTALLSPGDLIKDFNEEVKIGDTVWLINTTGFGNYQPTVPGNWLKQEEKGFQDVYDYRGWIIVTKYQVK